MPTSERHGLTTDRPESTPAPIRIDVGRSLRALLFTLVLPVSLAMGADWLAGTLPWVTIAAVLVCIPLATVVVNRTVLAEFNRVVALVALLGIREAGADAGSADELAVHSENNLEDS